MIKNLKDILIITGIDLAITLIFFLVLLIKMKTRNATCYTIIRAKQLYINMIISSYIFACLPIIPAFISWMCLFFVLKHLLKNDKYRLSTISQNHQQFFYVTSFSQCKQILNSDFMRIDGPGEYGYTFMFHAHSFPLILLSSMLGITESTHVSENVVVFLIEYLIITISVAIPMAPLLFELFWSTPGGISSNSTFLSTISVIFIELLYLGIAVCLCVLIITNNLS